MLGIFFAAVIPGLGLPLGIALGAILSPTDAVATSIIKRPGIQPRVVTMLDGESLLNDATSLVLLRTAVAAVAGGFSFIGAVGTFAWNVVIAIVVGAAIGWVNLRLRKAITTSAASTAIGFVAPFAAYLPTEHLGGSGLVAAVVAGAAARGRGLPDHGAGGQRTGACGTQRRRHLAPDRGRSREERPDSLHSRLGRALADLDNYENSPLTWRRGTVIVWAGMRGVVTLAAAQTLPAETPSREVLVLVAFFVALGSLMIQGFTLPLLIRLIGPDAVQAPGADPQERSQLTADLHNASTEALQTGRLRRPDGGPFPPGMLVHVEAQMTAPPSDDDDSPSVRDRLELRWAMLAAMRTRLDDLSRGGTYSTAVLRHALAELDAEQLSLQLRLEGD